MKKKVSRIRGRGTTRQLKEVKYTQVHGGARSYESPTYDWVSRANIIRNILKDY